MTSKRREAGVRFPDVVVLEARAAWPVLLIEDGGRLAWIHRDYLLGDDLQRPGDRGLLVLSRWAAEGYGLLRAESKPEVGTRPTRQRAA